MNGKGEYELHAIEMLPTPAKAKDARAFVFTRQGKTMLACWHMSGSGSLDIALGADGKKSSMPVSGLRYLETDLSVDGMKAAYADAEMR